MSGFNQPLSGNEMPRFAGNASMFRLPLQETGAGLDVAIVGVPLDIGTSNRTGTRYGPRQIRAESVLVRPYGMATRAAPFDSFQVADTGDVALNPYNLEKSIALIENHYDELLRHVVIPVSLGGDHTIAVVENKQKPKMPILNHNGIDVETQDEVNEAHELVVQHAEGWGIGKITKPALQHGTYSFFFWDADDNCWEILTNPKGGYVWLFEKGDLEGRGHQDKTFERPGMKKAN